MGGGLKKDGEATVSAERLCREGERQSSSCRGLKSDRGRVVGVGCYVCKHPRQWSSTV